MDLEKDGNSFKPVARTTTNADGTSTSTIPGAVTVEEKIQKKKDLKARSILMMTLPSEHLLTFNQYKDAKTLFEAIEARFGGNKATKKTQKTLLKQITNDVNTSNILVNTASSSFSTASSTDNTARLSDATIYAFLANQPNGSQVVHEDLEQIHEDNFEEMDLKWQLALLKESSFKAMLDIDGAGFDWSFMTEEEVPTNFALMTFSDSEVHNNKTCSKTYLKSFEDLKSQYDNLIIELNKSKSDLANYKRGLASMEEQLVFYKKNEGMLCDQIVVFKRDASFNESEINALKIQIERLKKEKESNQIKIDNFENAFKNLDKLIGSQISDNNRKGMGYNAVASPPTGLFTPPTIDLSNSGLEEFKQPEFEGYEVKVNKSVSENSSNEIKKTSDAPIIKDWVSDCDEDETLEKVSESANVQKLKQDDQPRKISQNPRNNSTNWNTPMSKNLGMVQKPVLNNVKKWTGQREVRPVWNNAMRTNHQNFSNSRRNFAPTAVLTKSGIVPISTARQRCSKAATPLSVARPIKTAAPKSFVNVTKTRPNAFPNLHSPSRRPFYQQTALKNRNLNNKVNTVKCWVYTTQQMVINSPCLTDKKELAIPGQTTTDKKCQTHRKIKKGRDTKVPQSGGPLTKVGGEAVHKELGDRMEKAVTTASSFEAEQDSGGYTPGSDEGRKKLNELMELCTKLSEKVTSLEQDLKQTKQVYGKALTKLVKKVKHLEDQLKSTTKRRKAKVVISDEEEDLVSEDPSKQGRMSETEYEDVETEHAEEESSEVHLDVLSAAKILADAS
ncbi:hypothetical protein Tco_1068442 [Tanacetum coccineum]|uniref:Uncharacterized protein n=1 Tax=Tanacetum coccineum TaxID=301880 RepID=A0ABQ5HG94_9ASTR